MMAKFHCRPSCCAKTPADGRAQRRRQTARGRQFRLRRALVVLRTKIVDKNSGRGGQHAEVDPVDGLHCHNPPRPGRRDVQQEPDRHENVGDGKQRTPTEPVTEPPCLHHHDRPRTARPSRTRR
jgi:hypothetical protein